MFVKGILSRPVGELKVERLGDRGVVRVADAGVGFADRAQHYEACGVDADGHIGQRERHRLVLVDRLAHRLALERIACGLVRRHHRPRAVPSPPCKSADLSNRKWNQNFINCLRQNSLPLDRYKLQNYCSFV